MAVRNATFYAVAQKFLLQKDSNALDRRGGCEKLFPSRQYQLVARGDDHGNETKHSFK